MTENPRRPDVAAAIRLIKKMSPVLTAMEGERQARARELPHRIRPLIHKCREACLAAKERDRNVATDFNIFYILGLQRRECRTHSKFIRELLDPTGAHAQGDLFLRHFLKMVLGAEMDTAGWRSTVEDFIENGRLDILLRRNGMLSHERMGIIIENKIDAPDQDTQIKRYQEWARTEWPDDRWRLVYLTVDGKPPSDASTMNAGQNVQLLSYRRDIKHWLSACVNAVAAPSVSLILKQYLTTIEDL